jgi:YD repeat-containing protein
MIRAGYSIGLVDMQNRLAAHGPCLNGQVRRIIRAQPDVCNALLTRHGNGDLSLPAARNSFFGDRSPGIRSRRCDIDPGSTWGYGYDGRNRLTVVQQNGATVATYVYNSSGLRVSKVPAATNSPVRFVYGPDGLLAGECCLDALLIRQVCGNAFRYKVATYYAVALLDAFLTDRSDSRCHHFGS